jgi:hypothetical protein
MGKTQGSQSTKKGIFSFRWFVYFYHRKYLAFYGEADPSEYCIKLEIIRKHWVCK